MIITIRSAFTDTKKILVKRKKLYYWLDKFNSKRIPTIGFNTRDDALYFARLWEYKYYRNTPKYFNLYYKDKK